MERPEKQVSTKLPSLRIRGPGPRPDPPRKTRHIILAHVLFVLTILVYAGSVNNEFVLRDGAVIVGNRWVRSITMAPAFFRPEFWRTEMNDVLSGYRPVVLVSYAADFILWRKDALGFHLTNLFLHGLAVTAFFFLARRLVGDDDLAFLAGVLFAFHPASTEAVCYLAVRATLLAWALTLAAWLAWWRSWQEVPNGEPTKHRWGWYSAALSLHGLGLGSSGAAAVLPLLQLATLSFVKKDVSRRTPPWLGIVPFGLLSLGALVLHWTGATAPQPLFAPAGSPGSTILHLGGAASAAARLVLFPVHLVAGRPLSEAASLWAGLLLLSGAGLFCLWGRRQYPRTTFGLIITGLTIAPPLLTMALRGEAYGEHHLYGATAGFALTMLALIYEAKSGSRAHSISSRGFSRLTLAALVTVGLTFAVSTANRHMAWENSSTISQVTLRSWPSNVPLQAYLGRLWVKAKNLERAEALLAELRSKAPNRPETLVLEGEVALARGDAPEAAKAFGRAAALRPRDLSAATRETEALLEANRLDQAEVRISDSLRRHPQAPGLLYAKGRTAERRGRLQEALEAYRRAAAMAPHREEYHLAHGKGAKAVGLTSEAESAFRAAIREGPGLLEAYGALASLLLEQGRSRETVYLLASVARWHPERPELVMLLAEAWSKEGYPDRAEELYRNLLNNNNKGREAHEIRATRAKQEQAKKVESKPARERR